MILPHYFCTWKPGRGPSRKTYTLVIKQTREWKRFSLSLSPSEKDGFSSVFDLETPNAL